MNDVITIDGIAYSRITHRDREYNEVVDDLNWLMYEIRSNHKNAVELYDDMKENGFSVGMIEAEGYLRCATTLLNFMNSNLNSEIFKKSTQD